MKILEVNKLGGEDVVEKGVKVLKDEGMVIYPTETCYGVGVDVTNQEAVNKLLEYKRRPEGKAVSLAVSDKEMAEEYVEINETAKNLYENFLPGPLTVVSKSRGKVADGLEAEDATLGVRIPDYPLVLQIIKRLGRPITATSANSAGKKTPYSVDDILDNISKKQKDLINLIIDSGRLPKNPPSTVVDTTVHDMRVIRGGKIDLYHENIKTKKHKNKNIKKNISQSEEETIEIAEKLMKNLLSKLKEKCLIFALQGELGVGKTRFAKGVARGLGIEQTVVSPTYMLVREYEFNMGKWINGYMVKRENNETMKQWYSGKLFHVDTWRMQSADELLDLGFYDMLRPGNLIVIEWLEKVGGVLEKVEKKENVKVIWVDMGYEREEERKITWLNG